MALVAIQALLSSMNLKMLIKICFLSKCLAAVWMFACERSFTSMYSQVIEEIMPFSENHFASLKVALKQLDKTVSLWVLVLKNSESLCSGDRFFDL